MIHHFGLRQARPADPLVVRGTARQSWAVVSAGWRCKAKQPKNATEVQGGCITKTTGGLQGVVSNLPKAR
jgi:hypothetical protein